MLYLIILFVLLGLSSEYSMTVLLRQLSYFIAKNRIDQRDLYPRQCSRFYTCKKVETSKKMCQNIHFKGNRYTTSLFFKFYKTRMDIWEIVCRDKSMSIVNSLLKSNIADKFGV